MPRPKDHTNGFKKSADIAEPENTEEANISEEEFDELIRKMRQSFQSALIVAICLKILSCF